MLVAAGKLLDSPGIAIGIVEEQKPPGREVLDLSDFGAGVALLRLCGLDVVDDHLESLCGARWRCGDAVADDDRAARSGRRYLYETQLITEAMIVVDVVPDPLVERLGHVDVAHGHSDDFKLVVHFRLFVAVSTATSVLCAAFGRIRQVDSSGWAVLAIRPPWV